MRLFLLNVLLAVGWMLMWGSFSIWALVAGFIAGDIVLMMVTRTSGRRRTYGTKAIKLLAFLAYFVKILVLANLLVAREIIWPTERMAPRFIRYSVKDMTEVQITTLANLITLTPGTLSVDLNDAGDYLYIHCMFGKDRLATLRELDELKDRLLTEVFG